MLFRKKKKLESIKEVAKDDFEVTNLKETYGADIEDEILKKLEKLSFAIAIGARDEDVREKALNLFGRVKIARAVRKTDKEELIKFYTKVGASDEFVEKLKNEGLLEVTYKVSGVEITAKDKEEIAKKIEEFLQEELDLKDEVKMALSGKPLKVDEENAEIMGKLYELGFYDIYLVPKNWFDLPHVNGIDVEKALKEFKELKEGLPEHISRFLNNEES